MSELVYRPAHQWTATKKVVQWNGEGEIYLTAIEIIDLQRDGNNADVGLFGGGVGKSSLSLKFLSHLRAPINYRVTLYGRLYEE